MLNKGLQLPYLPTLCVNKTILGGLRKHWIDTVFESYDKMYITGTLSCLIRKSTLTEGAKILPEKILFEVSITDIAHFHELETRFCTNSMRHLEVINLEVSFEPVADAGSLLLVISLTTSEGIIFISIYVSDALHTNIMSNPEK